MSNPWRKRTLLFLVSQCVTLFGSTLVQMAMVWYITLETTSGAWIAALTVCAYLPQFLISFVGGVWADRHNRKLLIIGADATIAAATLLLFLLMPMLSSRPLLLGAILAVSILRSLGAGIQTPAVNAVIPALVPEEHLMRYNGINAAMQSVVQFAAPATAGLILSFGTLRLSLLIDILTAVVGIGLLSCILLPTQNAAAAGNSVLQDMKQGIHETFSHKFLGRLLIVYGLFIFLSVPAGFLAQLLVSRTYGSSYGYLTAVELVGFAGMTGGGLLIGIWGGFQSRIKTLVVGLSAFGLLAVGMGLSRSFILYLALMLLYGIALTTVQAATTTLIQENAAAEMQGRVFGFMGSMYSGFLPLGMATFGPLADIIPLPNIMMATGGVLVIIALLAATDKRFRTVRLPDKPSQQA